MTNFIDRERLYNAYQTAKSRLMQERVAAGWWEGELSTSALSTATAVVAFEMVSRRENSRDESYAELIDRGLAWLAAHQNDDGGWGDTVKSFSNISTTMLAQAAFVATGQAEKYQSHLERAASYVQELGGVDALIKRYGKDKTFSVPILTQCALAGMVEWNQIPPLPFELACLPHRFYKTVKLPVVSYALPALIAIGQVRHHFAKSWNPVSRFVRNLSIKPTLKKLISLQPTSGGFLEAAPLTSFVTMSLAAMGLHEHPVVKQGVQFLLDSVRPDGSWPIDTNLATWTTTLSVNAVDGKVTETEPIIDFLLQQQYREVHPYTNADPGGWAWTDLSGGVPDADDTPGAILALLNLNRESNYKRDEEIQDSTDRGVKWLLDLQNRDGGWPTFCKGWGVLPFDRSSPDLTAHCLRALRQYQTEYQTRWTKSAPPVAMSQIENSIRNGFSFLRKKQLTDGSWLPLWFGNQHAEDEENPLYGTARVIAAWSAPEKLQEKETVRALNWISRSQSESGGWSGQPGLPESVEETALAVEMLLTCGGNEAQIAAGLNWLIAAVESDQFVDPSPIGFYFAKLWYFELLYPLIFTVAALHRACEQYPVSQ